MTLKPDNTIANEAHAPEGGSPRRPRRWLGSAWLRMQQCSVAPRAAARGRAEPPAGRLRPLFHAQATHGFTLMEILLAVLIFSIVLAAIQSVFFAALKLRNSTTAAVEGALPLERTLEVIKHDLANLVMPTGATGGVFTGTLQSSPTTSGNSLSGNSSGFGTMGNGSGMQFGSVNSTAGGMGSGPVFYTASGSINQWSPYAEVEKVTYYLAAPTNDSPGMDLVRVVVRNLLPVAEEEYAEQFLMGGVQEIGFQYFDGTQWLDTWDSTLVGDPSSTITNALPRAIKFSLQLAEQGTTRSMLAPVELVVPLFLQTVPTNQAAATDTTGGGG